MKGFTLIELMIVIAMIVILTTLAMLNTASMTREAQVNEARDLVVADLEFAKLTAMTGDPHAIIVSGGASTFFTLNKLNDANGNFFIDSGETVTLIETKALPSHMKIYISGEQIWFDRKGIPRTGTWETTTGTTIRIWYDLNNNNAFDSDEPKQEIALSSMGRLRYEK